MSKQVKELAKVISDAIRTYNDSHPKLTVATTVEALDAMAGTLTVAAIRHEREQGASRCLKQRTRNAKR